MFRATSGNFRRRACARDRRFGRERIVSRWTTVLGTGCGDVVDPAETLGGSLKTRRANAAALFKPLRVAVGHGAPCPTYQCARRRPRLPSRGVSCSWLDPSPHASDRLADLTSARAAADDSVSSRASLQRIQRPLWNHPSSCGTSAPFTPSRAIRHLAGGLLVASSTSTCRLDDHCGLVLIPCLAAGAWPGKSSPRQRQVALQATPCARPGPPPHPPAAGRASAEITCPPYACPEAATTSTIRVAKRFLSSRRVRLASGGTARCSRHEHVADRRQAQRPIPRQLCPVRCGMTNVVTTDRYAPLLPAMPMASTRRARPTR